MTKIVDKERISIMSSTTDTPTISSEVNALGHPLLKPKTPVPSDIQISQDIVNEVGLLPIKDVAKE